MITPAEIMMTIIMMIIMMTTIIIIRLQSWSKMTKNSPPAQKMIIIFIMITKK